MVFKNKANADAFAKKSKNAKGSSFVMTHADHDHHVVVTGADSQRMKKNGYRYADSKGESVDESTKHPTRFDTNSVAYYASKLTANLIKE